VRGTHPTLAVATVKINDKHIEVIVRHMLRIPHNPLYLFCQCHIVATNLRPKKIRFFQKIGFLSPKKIRFFQKNRIFKPLFSKNRIFKPQKNPIFSKNRIFKPQKKIRFLSSFRREAWECLFAPLCGAVCSYSDVV
jgi:hypothetical protein